MKDTAFAAAAEHDAAALYMYGEKARLNIPRSQAEIITLLGCLSSSTKLELDFVSECHGVAEIAVVIVVVVQAKSSKEMTIEKHTSTYKGVSYDGGVYRVRIFCGKQQVSCGR